MTKYIDKATVVAEIEKRKQEWKYGSSIEAKYKHEECDDILSSINTIEVKEVDLEKETKKWWNEHLHLNPKNQLWMDAYQSITFAKHFFELGLKVQKGE